MNALSGLDPKYIDEAAYELHGKPAVHKATSGAKVKRGLFIAIPIAAAALLTIGVALPAIIRLSQSGSTYAPAASDSAQYYEAAEPGAYEDAAAAEDYEDAAAAEDYAPVAESTSDESYSEATDTAASVSAESASKAEESDTAATNTSSGQMAETGGLLQMKTADYTDGILTIETEGVISIDPAVTAYAIVGAGDDDDSMTVYAEGLLADVLTDTDPLTLDLTSLELPDGNYVLAIGEETIEFTK
jgi:hypothetical protein